MYATAIAEKIKEKSEWEAYLVKNRIYNGALKDYDLNFERAGLNAKYDKDEYKLLTEVRIFTSGVLRDNYYYTKSVSQRVLDTPETYKNIIHLFGDSTIMNAHIPMFDRAGMVLQRLCNEAFARGVGYKVEDNTDSAMGIAIQCNYLQAKENDIKPGDIVVVTRRHGCFGVNWFNSLEMNGIPHYDSLSDFQRPHDMGEVFLNAHHMNYIGAEKNAQLIFRELFENKRQECTAIEFKPYFRKQLPCVPILDEWYDPIAQSVEFREYISKLKEIKTMGYNKIGSIVMNCNPFTLGHEYLIDYASKQVEHLYIFAVEENRSIFPFEDRIELMRQGTSDLSNVKVLPSGNFIISTLTFPEYFEKGDKQEDIIDPSQDVELFAKYIAPTLGITVRFAGEEPLDNITQQYNDTMRRILPSYGIEFEVILRKESGGEVISASRVRKLLEMKDFDAVSKLVPETTLAYLKRKFI